MKGIMIQGTASDVGKSYVTTAICRLLSNKGFSVAPFKSQNMSNNSYVTIDNLEMGRAQGTQAEAARVIPRVYMNPILLKPKRNMMCEVVLNGTVFNQLKRFNYGKDFTLSKGIDEIKKALNTHQEHHDYIVIEGAGSPGEINLNDREIVNMRVAELADVDVILVADIDRGGSFASIVGTLELLFEHRKRVKGIIINKFRGDVTLFQDGIKWLEEYTGVKVLGVLPYMDDIYIETEDAQSDMLFKHKEGNLDIAVIKLERVSNNTDIEPFLHEEDVNIRLVSNMDDFGNPDAVIIPGTKSTIDDLQTLKDKGLDTCIKNYINKGGYVIGICGGYQMLGKKITDPAQIDGNNQKSIDGLGVFNIDTLFQESKHVNQIESTELKTGSQLTGFEIHLGETIYYDNQYFSTFDDGRKDGSIYNDYQVIGTYIHGIFHNDIFRTEWLNRLRKEPKEAVNTTKKKEESFERLATVFEENIDIDYLMKLMNK